MGSPGATLFTASSASALLDHFRIPHRLLAHDPRSLWEQIARADGGPSLLWPRRDSSGAPVRGRLSGLGRLSPPLFAAVMPDRACHPLLNAARGGTWRPLATVTDHAGHRLASVWSGSDGSVFLPFDPSEVIVNYWSEGYRPLIAGDGARAGKRALLRAYYRLRPLLPRALQIWLRRRLAVLQARTRFPSWPVETGLHDFLELMLGLLAAVAGEPVPHIAPWPDGHRWAFVLTHDVEQAAGWNALGSVLALERELDLRSAFNLVPRRYTADPQRVQQFVAAGFEVGVHGLYHDGRDLESRAMLERRLPAMRQAAGAWGAHGFRSPATHRDWELMPLLGFDYDSSYPDTDPFEPQGGGCCSWLPFFDQDMVELPLTMPQDHTLFTILGGQDEQPWVDKAEFLRRRGGMAMLDTHPDYLIDARIMGAYTRLLRRYAGDETAWRALPREVSAWWRCRAASRLERTEAGRDGDGAAGWRILGPAAARGRVLVTG